MEEKIMEEKIMESYYRGGRMGYYYQVLRQLVEDGYFADDDYVGTVEAVVCSAVLGVGFWDCYTEPAERICAARRQAFFQLLPRQLGGIKGSRGRAEWLEGYNAAWRDALEALAWAVQVAGDADSSISQAEIDYLARVLGGVSADRLPVVVCPWDQDADWDPYDCSYDYCSVDWAAMCQ